jgi:hypothetical protein
MSWRPPCAGAASSRNPRLPYLAQQHGAADAGQLGGTLNLCVNGRLAGPNWLTQFLSAICP